MAAIAYWCATRHVPAVQQQIQTNAEAAVSSVVANNVTTSVYGRTVTLEGSVASESQKTELLSAVDNADGVRHINDDQLTVLGGVAAVTPSNDTSVAQTGKADTSNEQIAQTDNTAEETPSEPTVRTAAVEPPSSETPTPESPSVNSESTAAPSTGPSNPEAPEAPEAPESPVPVAEVPPPSPETASPEGPSAEPSSSPTAPTPESPSPVSPPSPESPSPESPSPDSPSPVQPTANEPNSVATAAPDENAQPADGELAELTVANEPAPNNLSDAPSPEAAGNTSAALIDALDEESSTFSMQIKDDTLTLSGDISTEDDSLAFIQSAMRTFDVNYVVNSIQENEDNTKASWLPALTEFIPNMEPISDASIDIFESQVRLSGIAPDAQTHEQITDKALSLLSELSLVDSIVLSTDDPNTATTSNAEPDVAPTIEPTDTTPQENTQNTAQKAVDQPNAEKTLTTAAELSTLREAFKALEAEKILFQSGSDVLTEESVQTIAAMSALLAKYTDINIEIDGHTDSAGSSEDNLQLSQLRANAVRDLMIERGIARERLSAYGFGDGVPIADNGTAEGRKLNRRIEFNF